VLREGKDVSLITTGTMTAQALAAASELDRLKIDVELVHAPTIKPLDDSTILKSAKKTGKVITIEEAQINGGLGGAVAELLSENLPTPMKRMGMRDCFGESVKPEELLKKFGLDAAHIVEAAKQMVGKKNV